MAIDPKDLTIDYRKIQSMPFRDRKALLFSSFADQVNSALTPSQRANLFPNYYVQSATSGATPGAGGDPNLSKADYLNRARNGGVSDSDLNRVSGKPEERGPPQITASEFRAVESNPFLAGYADKTSRKNQSVDGVTGIKKRDPGARGNLGFTQNTSLSPKKRALLDAIATDSGGGYGTVNYVARGQGAQDAADLSKGHPFITDSGKVLKGYTASGRYQMLATNYDVFARKIGAIDPKTGNPDFSPEAQDKVAFEMAKDVYAKGTGGRNLEDDLDNPEITPDQLIRPLSIDYGWHILKTEEGMQTATNVFANNEKIYTEDLAEAIADQTTPTAQPDAMAVVDKVMSETPSAVELRTSAENLDINSTPESALAFLNNKERNPDGANLVDVDARLLELAEMGIRKFETENPNLKVEIYGPSSGKRQSSVTKKSQHLVGKALDFEIFEVDPKTGQKTGKRLPNFRTQAGAGEAGDEYLNLHQNIELARIYKKEVIKDQRYEGVYGRSGALFGGEYALDTQHYDIGGAPAADGIMSASGPNTDQPGGSIFGGYSEEYMRRFGVESAAMPIQQDKVVELAKSTYGPKETATAVSTTSSTTPSAVPAVTTVAPAPGVTTSGVTTAAAPPAPESTDYPIKTMAQGGIIPKSADTQIVQRNMSGDIISATKVGENENEKMSIEPISKMSADALTVGSYNPVNEDMINSKSQSAPEDKKVSMTSRSVAQPRLSSDPYSNIQGDIKSMSPTARAAMMAARDLSTQRRGYSL